MAIQHKDLVIEVAGLTKTYDGCTVVDNVGFDVADGEIFGILGVNGAGKTTVVECLQGLRRPDHGRLRVLGLDPVQRQRQLRSLVGSQLQDAALPDRLRVHEAVALFSGPNVADPTALLTAWGLEPKRKTSVADLSGGQRQRLFIILALLNNPRIVFFDELTQGLDPIARRDVWDAILDVRAHGTTVVLVSHFMDEAEALCDRVAVMAAGRIIDTGTPTELVHRHARATTVTFTPPASFDPVSLNRLPDVDRVERLGEHLQVTGGPGLVAPVCAATLDDHGQGPPDLRVHQPTLEDALLTLTAEGGPT
jgi:ABC-2 type transport system ATP-binding protein